ncbi:hypothetical protein B0H13DRAFT_1860917 [Mycena leptocephala]|nr:hypothetical protein B0H13DRAFT_1860917 [Mycena leptocephala]
MTVKLRVVLPAREGRASGAWRHSCVDGSPGKPRGAASSQLGRSVQRGNEGERARRGSGVRVLVSREEWMKAAPATSEIHRRSYACGWWCSWSFAVHGGRWPRAV